MAPCKAVVNREDTDCGNTRIDMVREIAEWKTMGRMINSPI
jgi:hypothetical protein